MAANLKEAIGDGLHTSISQIKAFLICPRQFELRYVRGLVPEFVPRNLAFGTAFHAALARHYLDLRDSAEATSHEQLVQTFKDAWNAKLEGKVPLEPVDDEEPADPVDLAAKMLKAFDTHAEATEMDLVVEAVEQPFGVTLFDPDTGEVAEERLVGVIDLVVREGDRLVVVEHKTSARKYGIDQLRYDIQPTAYQMAMREQWAGEVGLRYQVVTKTKVPAVQLVEVRRNDEDEKDFGRIALGVLKAIDAGVSYPVRGWQCRSCPYKQRCGGGR